MWTCQSRAIGKQDYETTGEYFKDENAIKWLRKRKINSNRGNMLIKMK